MDEQEGRDAHGPARIAAPMRRVPALALAFGPRTVSVTARTPSVPRTFAPAGARIMMSVNNSFHRVAGTVTGKKRARRGRDIQASFSRRERQIMDAVYALGEAGAAEVVEHLGEPSAHDSVRVTLANLEKKGYLRHRTEGQRNIYVPKVSREEARRSAMRHLVATFFGGSPKRAIVALLDEAELNPEQLEEIARLIEQEGGE